MPSSTNLPPNVQYMVGTSIDSRSSSSSSVVEEDNEGTIVHLIVSERIALPTTYRLKPW